MTDNDPPVAADDFPEFGEPPRHVPPHVREPRKPAVSEPTDTRQEAVDAVIARLRRKRAEDDTDAHDPAQNDEPS